jgi:hypothetical protein
MQFIATFNVKFAAKVPHPAEARIEQGHNVMVEFSSPGVAFHYTMAGFLFLSCALLFVCAKADEMNRAPLWEELTRTLDESAKLHTIDYENYAAQYIQAAQHPSAHEQRALLLMIARAWTEMAEQARRIRWAMSLIEASK